MFVFIYVITYAFMLGIIFYEKVMQGIPLGFIDWAFIVSALVVAFIGDMITVHNEEVVYIDKDDNEK